MLEALYPGSGKLVARAWSDADRVFMDNYWRLIEAMPVRSRFFVMGRRLHGDMSMIARSADAPAAPIAAA